MFRISSGNPRRGKEDRRFAPRQTTGCVCQYHSRHRIKILVEGELAGGAIVYAQGQGRYYLGRVFLDPAMHRQGIGLAVMQLIFAHFPDACRWTLETPPWNTRTRNFYQRLGFQIVKETEEDLFFEKVMA